MHCISGNPRNGIRLPKRKTPMARQYLEPSAHGHVYLITASYTKFRGWSVHDEAVHTAWPSMNDDIMAALN